VAPGQYTVKLTVDGKSYAQPITVKMDPRVRLTAAEVANIGAMSKQLYDGVLYAQESLQQIQSIRDQVKSLQQKAGEGALAKSMAAFDQKAAALQGSGGGAGMARGGRPGAGAPAPDAAAGRGAPGPPAAAGRGAAGGPGAATATDTLSAIGPTLSAQISPLQAAEATPTAQTLDSIIAGLKSLAAIKARWNALKTLDLPALNAQLKQAGLPQIEVK
jgi:hypothetical protein